MPSKEHLLDIRRFNGEEGLHAIKDDWNHVLRGMSCKRYFHLYQWYSSYIRTLEDVPSDVNFFVAYRHGEPVAVFPLRFEHQSVLGLKSKNLAVPIHGHMSQSDFVFEKNDENRDLLCEFIDYLIAQQDFTWDMLVMPHILEGSSALYGITNCRRRITYVKKVGGCHYIKCKAYDKMLKGFSKSFRYQLRKARKRLAQLDGVEYTSERHGDNLFQSLDEFLDVEASGWKGIAGTKSAINLHPEIEEFYRCLAGEFSAFNGCEINLLKAEGVCLAGQFCLLVDDTYYILKIGYNEKYRKISPGYMMREHFFKDKAACEGTKYINMVTAVDWHRIWQPLSYDVFNAYVFNRSARGVGFYALLRTKKALASVYHKFIKMHLC